MATPDGRLRHVTLIKRLPLVLLVMLSACSLGRPTPEDTPAKVLRPGGTIKVAILEPDSLDPAKASSRSALMTLKQVCEPLVRSDPRTGALKPGVAKSWEISADAKTITFKLREDAAFHNARKIVAEDFVFSMSRFVHPKQGSSEHFLLDKVAGYADVRNEKAAALAGAKAPDPQTLVVELSSPFAEFPAVMSNPAAGAVVPKEEVEKAGEGFGAAPVCNGSYSLAKPWTKGQENVLTKRDGAKTLPKSLVFVPVADLATGYGLFEKGTVDIADVPLAKLTSARAGKGKVDSGANGLIAYIGYPTKKPPFDNVLLRRSLSLSIDRTALIEELLIGSRQLPRGFLPSPAGEASKSRCATLGKKADAEAAKKALQESKIDPASLKPSVYLNASGGHERWLEKVREQWKATLGIEASLKPDEWKKYLDFLVDPGADGPFRLAWAVRYPSAEAAFDPLFLGSSLDNFSKYQSADFDAALTKARATVNDSARLDAYVQAASLLCNDMPIVPVWFGQNHVAFNEGLRSRVNIRLDTFGDPVLGEIGRIN